MAEGGRQPFVGEVGVLLGAELGAYPERRTRKHGEEGVQISHPIPI